MQTDTIILYYNIDEKFRKTLSIPRKLISERIGTIYRK